MNFLLLGITVVKFLLMAVQNYNIIKKISDLLNKILFKI
ncbi:hypothetical protein A33Q_1675 [Indibacter alkaliphilus LW1]|uniref:Uncharacterized protein n=1 Tax=Indibacter alkaliphilus (strain CCUG 57479 / KCTC 22604 / LW1) TaxID=1189612 RepID=S2DF07_INDAL|nr:hypothetical protein A33Q_1675 [Indibacter alkaliphilus LW1]